MQNRLSARSTAFRIAVALTVSLLLCLLLIGASRGQAAAAQAKRCSTSGLRFTEHRGGATLSTGVADLRAKTITCTVARAVASRVARDLLHEVKVPTHIRGLRVTVKEPCTGCTPDTLVSAKSVKGSVTFTVRGGV